MAAAGLLGPELVIVLNIPRSPANIIVDLLGMTIFSIDDWNIFWLNSFNESSQEWYLKMYMK